MRTTRREADLRSHALLQEPWYHQIELLPGLFTPGKPRANLALARKLAGGCDLRGQRVLDVGAMDGLMSLLALRRGAERVVAYDRLSYEPRINLLKKVLEVDWDYVSGLPLRQLPDAGRRLEASPFDVVFFFGRALPHVRPNGRAGHGARTGPGDNR